MTAPSKPFTKKLDVPVKSGGKDREHEYFEYHRARGIRLRRRYTPEGQYAKRTRGTA